MLIETEALRYHIVAFIKCLSENKYNGIIGCFMYGGELQGKIDEFKALNFQIKVQVSDQKAFMIPPKEILISYSHRTMISEKINPDSTPVDGYITAQIEFKSLVLKLGHRLVSSKPKKFGLGHISGIYLNRKVLSFGE